MRTVIFDLDGTLADTSGDLIAAANVALAELGLAERLDPHRDAATALRGGKRMLDLALSRAGIGDRSLIEAGYPVLLEAYGAAIDVHTRLYPGAVAAVETLISADYGVGICTNKPQALADELLRRLGVRGLFASLIGADTLAVRKPDPEPLRMAARQAGGDPARCLLVGDSDTDRSTASAAGVPCILVTFGPSGADMAALAPEALLDDYADLPGVVDELIG
ncbi:MAG: HAD-IA family hydrolase [Marinibacterium sp.]